MHPPASLIQLLWMLAGQQQIAKHSKQTQHLLQSPPEPEEWAHAQVSYTNIGTDFGSTREFIWGSWSCRNYCTEWQVCFPPTTALQSFTF